MADFTFNIALGRIVELYRRANNNDPANAALVVVALKEAGLSADAALKDLTTLAAVLSNGSTAEATNTGYARKVLGATPLLNEAVNHTNDRIELSIPDQVWTAVAAAGGAWKKLLVCYDSDSTGGTDSAIIPLTAHDFSVVPAGVDITARIPTTGFFRAQ